MKKSMIMFAVATLIGFTACEKENEINAPNTSKNDMLVFDGYTIQDGYLKFDSQESYDKSYKQLSQLSDDKLKEWNDNLPIKTLYTVYYENNIPEFFVTDYELEYEAPTYIINDKRTTDVFATMLNVHGVVMYGETLIKVQDEFLYKITDCDSLTAKLIANGANIPNTLKYEKIRHTTELYESETPKTHAKSYNDRTNLFYVSKTVRDHVIFKARKSGNGSSYQLILQMKGMRQNRVLGVWLFPFADRIAGTITVTADSFYQTRTFPVEGDGKIDWDVTPNITSNQVTVKYDFIRTDVFKGTQTFIYQKDKL